MMIDPMRDQVSVCGVGLTELGKFPDKTSLVLAVDAFERALVDSGLNKSEVDGYVSLSYGTDYDRFLEATGLNVRYAYQGWHHGRFIAPTVQIAAMAIFHGLANTIAIVHGKRQRTFGSPEDNEMFRQGLGPHGESPSYGALSPSFGVAVSARRYFHKYGGGSENLAHIAVTLRENARLNPGAVRQEPMTIADHQASRWVVEPLRLFDCCQTNDGGACLILTRADRARDLAKQPVYLSGMHGVTAGPDNHNFGHMGLGVAQASNYIYEPTPDIMSIYESAGIERSDIDAISVYDAFTPTILYALERFGFCGPGEAKDFVLDGNIGLRGSLPVNTSGGLLSEGHVNGWNLMVEVVRQLRHECGDRQVANAEIMQWASFSGDSIIFRR